MPYCYLAPVNGRPVTFTGELLATIHQRLDGAKLYRTERGHHVVAYARAARTMQVSTYPDAATFGDAGLNDWHCATLSRQAGITASFLDHEPPLAPDLPDFVTIPYDRAWQGRVRFNGRRVARAAFQVHHVSSDHTDLYRTIGRQYITISRIHNGFINHWQVVHVAVFRTRKHLVAGLGYTQGAMVLYDRAGIDVTLHLP